VASITLYGIQSGKANLAKLVEGTDAAILSDIVRTTAGVASLWGDALTTAITIGGGATQTTVAIGKAGSSVTLKGPLLADEGIRGPDDGTGIIIGTVGAGASTGSALQVQSYTTTQRGFLVPANGMIAYNTTDAKIQGYEGGSWVNLRPGGALQDNFTATVNPTTTNDNTEGYSVGSRWVNVNNNTHWVALDVTTNAAIWSETTQDDTISGIAKLAPGEHMMGNLMNYPSTGGLTSSLVQYTQVYLSAGLQIDTVRAFINAGGSASRNYNVGLYSQTDPADRQGTPNTRERESGSIATTGLSGYVDGTFTSYTVPTSGYYWVGIVADSAAISWALSAVYRAGFLPQRDETSTGVVLPATAASAALTGATAAVYAAAVEVGF
jgi:hypothetical protein